MSKYSMGSGYVESKEETVKPSTEGVSREWKPSVRLQKREEKKRTKLRISDLYPEKQYIKEVNDSEMRYFLLLVIPVVVTAAFTAIQREDLHNKLVDLLVKVLGG